MELRWYRRERHGKIQRLVLGEFGSLNPARANGQARQFRVRAIAQAFREAGVETEVSTDIRTDLWRKFAFLALVAAACGLTRSPIGAIRSSALGRLLLERAIREVIAVGRAHGFSLSDDDVSRILEFCDTLPDSNKPSLLRDMEAARPPRLMI